MIVIYMHHLVFKAGYGKEVHMEKKNVRTDKVEKIVFLGATKVKKMME